MSTVFFVPDDPAFALVGFTCTTDEQHGEILTLTKVPIEDGSSVSDHAIIEPATFSCTVKVSQIVQPGNAEGEGRWGSIPIDVWTPQAGGVLIRSTESAFAFQETRKANRILEMQNALTELKNHFVTGTVITSAREYERMVITNISLPRGPKSIGEGAFTLVFEELRVVVTQSVTAPQPKEPKGAKAVDKGSGDPLEDIKKQLGIKLPEIDPNKSFAKQIGQGLGSLF